MKFWVNIARTIFCVFLLSLTAACTSVPRQDAAGEEDPFDARDPIKPVNQTIFSFNLGFDRLLMRPIAHTYHHIPEWGRTGIGNFLTNLSEPANMVNGLLQVNPDIFFTSFSRFAINSSVGLLGLRDVAGENGVLYQDQNFDKTLGSYGVEQGFYAVIPVLGPSTARGVVGQIADTFLDPVDLIFNTKESITQAVAQGISDRDDNDEIIDRLYYKAIDPYTATRATYLQHNALK